MPLCTIPPIPSFSLFLFLICGLIFILGMGAYFTERRKEIKKEKDRKEQSKSLA